MTKEQVYKILMNEIREQDLFECTKCDENTKNYELGVIDGMVIIAETIVKKLEENE